MVLSRKGAPGRWAAAGGAAERSAPGGRPVERGVTSGVPKVFPGKLRIKLSRVSKPCIFDRQNLEFNP